MRHRLPAMLLALTCVALSGCGGDEPRDLEISGGDDPSAEPTSSVSVAPPGNGGDPTVPEVSMAPPMGQKADEEYGVHALALPERPAARQVGETIVDYMTLRVETYHTRTFDLAAMARVASGQPLTGVQGWVPELKKRGVHTVGYVWLEIEDADVTVKGRRATFEDVCSPNSTVDVDKDSIAREEASPSYVISGSAFRAAKDIWIIDRFTIETRACRTKA